MGRKRRQYGSVIMPLCKSCGTSRPRSSFFFLLSLSFFWQCDSSQLHKVLRTSSEFIWIPINNLALHCYYNHACNYCDSNYYYCITRINLILGLDHPRWWYRDMPMKNGSNVPLDKSSIISCVPYRARVMVIIRATVSKVMQNNLERMPAAWLIGREGEWQEGGESRDESLSLCASPFFFEASTLDSFLTNALEIIEAENPVLMASRLPANAL